MEIKLKDEQLKEIVSTSAKKNQYLDTDDVTATSPWIHSLKQLRKNRLAVVGFFIIVLFILLGLIAPLITPYSYEEQVLSDRLQPPSSKNWLGTKMISEEIYSHELLMGQGFPFKSVFLLSPVLFSLGPF